MRAFVDQGGDPAGGGAGRGGQEYQRWAVLLLGVRRGERVQVVDVVLLKQPGPQQRIDFGLGQRRVQVGGDLQLRQPRGASAQFGLTDAEQGGQVRGRDDEPGQVGGAIRRPG